MRITLLTILCACLAPSEASTQSATVIGQVVLKESGEPLGYTTISVVSQGTSHLTSETARFMLSNLPPGEVRLRFRRIGFAPKDTAIDIAANDTARIRIEMTRLILQLPTTLISGACTDRTPFEEKPAVLAELFDQVRQNAERMRLLASERPFVFQAVSVGGLRDRDNRIVGSARVDTVERGPLPPEPYVPRRVSRPGRGGSIVKLPELPDLADTAFTNNHCLWYAGQTRFDADSVIRVDFEPVPWLAREVDLEGSIYLRADGYQLVGLVTRLNRIPPQNRAVKEYSVRARFSEIVSGIPMVAEWVLTNTMRNNAPGYVETGKVIGVRWLTPPRRTW